MINCDRARELFSDCVEGSTDHSLYREARKHIETCPVCNRDFSHFKRTWHMLESIPDVPVPSSLRHDVLMRMARLQHESRQSSIQQRLGWHVLLERLVPLRGIAVAVAAAVLAVTLLSLGDFVRSFEPGVQRSTTQTVTVDKPPELFAQTLGSPRVGAWKARTLGRNTLWVDVANDGSSDGTVLYRVVLSINQDAMLKDELANRIGAKVYLLPPGGYDPQVCKSNQPVWEGNILQDSPVIVPVVVNPYQSGTGCVNLLVSWSRYGREFGHLVILPASNGGGLTGGIDFGRGRASFITDDNSVYKLLQRVATEYWVPIVVNAYLEVEPSPVHFGGASMAETLQQILRPVDLDWLYAGQTVYVDYTYRLP